jgi:hypothetical protein
MDVYLQQNWFGPEGRLYEKHQNGGTTSIPGSYRDILPRTAVISENGPSDVGRLGKPNQPIFGGAGEKAVKRASKPGADTADTVSAILEARVREEADKTAAAQAKAVKTAAAPAEALADPKPAASAKKRR